MIDPVLHQVICRGLGMMNVCVLPRHNTNLQLAKIATLGGRVDNTLLIQGAEWQHNRAQIEIETELLEALA